KNVCLVITPKQILNSQQNISIYYHGKPREAVRPPWDGGWIWSKDSLGRPWMSVACQGLGASVWYPCKDYQGDEPDNSASLTITVADSLVAVGNGRLTNKHHNSDSTTSYTWSVVNPINNYLIVPYIGKYVNFGEVYKGEKGNLDVNLWVLDYNEQRAKQHSLPDVNRMLKAFEYWMGPYPFYEDGYKLVDAPHLGMEHQSATAYGNKYMNGYLGRDLSGTGWGLKWDFIIVHESGHEWFANNITSKDLADMWIHEGFTNYSETLFTEFYYGKEAGNAYNRGIRKTIRNDKPIIGHYGVNEEGSGDMYNKGGNMLHTIRHSMNDDEKFRAILRGLNKTFYHQTVTTKQVENYISEHAGFDYSKVFDQYLRTTQLPTFEFYLNTGKTKATFRYTNCVAGFDLPLVIKDSTGAMIKLLPTTQWKTKPVSKQQSALFTKEVIERLFYVDAEEKKKE
ncbi:MAG: M1 family metallopeptidase, partial [Bacteroidota bacterium]|nr:M1 family metallopeptidase [Bacteroidota bacterium]